MATKIVTKNSSTASAVPTAAQLVQGELAVNVVDKKLYTENNEGVIVLLADGVKLAGIEALADVTDTANVTAAGALMDSELTNITAVKALDQGVATTDSPTFAAATVTGEITANGGIALGDNDKATFGADDDLQIYHDGSHSQIKDAGTGNLYIKATSGVLIQDNDTGTNRITTSAAGPVYVYHAGDQKLATTSTGIDVTGTATMDGLVVNGAASISGVANANLQLASTGGNTYQLRTDVNSAYIYQANRAVPIAQFGYGGDISFYEDTGTTPKFFWDASSTRLTLDGAETSRSNNTYLLDIDNSAQTSNMATSGPFRVKGYYGDSFAITGAGNVGIGTSAPANSLTLDKNDNNFIQIRSSDTGNAGIYFGRQNDSVRGAIVYDNSNESIQFLNNNYNEKMRIDSSGNVGINTSTPNSNLSVHSATGGNAYIDVTRDNATSTALRLGAENGNTVINSVGAVPMAFYTNAAERMRIDSSGNVGIGTSSPDTLLEIVGADPILTIRDTETSGAATNATLRLAESGASDTLNNYWDINHTGNSELRFVSKIGLTTAERMRIDASGNLLVGKSGSSLSTAGFELYASGVQWMTSANARPLLLNRTGSDGAIQEFRKDGTTVGSIGTKSADLCIGTDDTGIRFGDGGNAVIPHNMATNTTTDDIISFGTATERFKHLYLSGGVYLGGTGAANKLDDYEEGTFTPVDDSGAALTFTTPTGKYTKIGNKVYVSCHITYPTTSSTVNIKIGGLPFGVGSSQSDRSGLSVSYTTYTTPVTVLGETNTTNVELFSFGGVRRTNADLSAKVIYIGGFYEIE